MTAALLIRNPTARGRLDEAKLSGVMAVAREAGWRVERIDTEHAGHATEIAREATTRGIDVIIVNGGDGTLNETINGIADSEVALAVLPAGTANVWAKEIRVPRDARRAMMSIVSGERRRVDLGRAGDRYFLLMAGVGLDASIIPRVSPRLKRRLGAASYILAGVITALSARSHPARLRFESTTRDLPVYWLLLGNTRSYGGLVDITHRAFVDDGLLDLCLMRHGGPLRLAIDGVRLLLKRHERSPNIDYLRTGAVEIETPGLPVQVDGEYMGETPMRFSVAPLALDVIVPPATRSPLFSRTRG